MPTRPPSSFPRKLSKREIEEGALTIEANRLENIARPLEIGDCVQILPRPQETHTQQLAHVIRILNKQHIIKLKKNG